MRVHNWQQGTASCGAKLAVVWNPPEDLFIHEPGIEVAFNMGAGVDALFKLPGRPANLQIVRVEDAGMAVQMAEYVVHYLVRAARSFDQYAVQQHVGSWARLPDIDRSAWSVGVLGAGIMGARVASAVAALDYPVAVWSRRGHELPGIEVYAGRDRLPEFLARSRVLVNVLPLTPETQGILRRDTLSQLLPDAYLINIARGGHLVEDDLLQLLADGRLCGAALDVFAEEPLPEGHPFWSHPKVSVTPHIAAASLLSETIAQITGKIRAYARGEALSGVVDPVLRY
ncbi:MAG: glyoxylate/hydroxypyruvate reductase A [Alcaligenaceae bacterium]|nr:glyoxylate/hydroxypyruvate reductase A [Alcaligenaceae bacterium]